MSTDRHMHRQTYLQEGCSEVPNGPWPLPFYGVNLTKLSWLTPHANFNPITPYCTNPNLTLTMAVQIVNLITYCWHVRTDRRGTD